MRAANLLGVETLMDDMLKDNTDYKKVIGDARRFCRVLLCVLSPEHSPRLHDPHTEYIDGSGRSAFASPGIARSWTRCRTW